MGCCPKADIPLGAHPGHSEPEDNVSEADIKASVTIDSFSRASAAEKALRAEAIEDREHLLSLVEKVQAENATLLARAQSAEADDGRVQARVNKIENQLERFRAVEFWGVSCAR